MHLKNLLETRLNWVHRVKILLIQYYVIQSMLWFLELIFTKSDCFTKKSYLKTSTHIYMITNSNLICSMMYILRCPHVSLKIRSDILHCTWGCPLWTWSSSIPVPGPVTWSWPFPITRSRSFLLVFRPLKTHIMI